MQKKLKGIVIAGATGVGKTDLSIKLAKQLNAVIISADASQVYKELNIGTAKITHEEIPRREHITEAHGMYRLLQIGSMGCSEFYLSGKAHYDGEAHKYRHSSDRHFVSG